MALTPEIDAFIAQINGLNALVAALDGVQPINVTIGTGGIGITVDPTVMPEAYTRGRDVLRSVAESAITDLRNAIASTAIAQGAA
jgi:hypothetical protein